MHTAGYSTLDQKQLLAGVLKQLQLTIMTMQLHVPRLESSIAPVASTASIDSTSCTNRFPSKAANDGCGMDAFEPQSQRQARDTNVHSTLSSFKRETLYKKYAWPWVYMMNKIQTGVFMTVCVGCMEIHVCWGISTVYTPFELYLCASMISWIKSCRALMLDNDIYILHMHSRALIMKIIIHAESIAKQIFLSTPQMSY